MKNPFVCDYCGKKFPQKSYLKVHKDATHKENPPKNTCEECGKSFYAKHQLRSHIKTVHQGIKDYKCKYCGNLFAGLDGMKKHIRTVSSFFIFIHLDHYVCCHILLTDIFSTFRFMKVVKIISVTIVMRAALRVIPWGNTFYEHIQMQRSQVLGLIHDSIFVYFCDHTLHK